MKKTFVEAVHGELDMLEPIIGEAHAELTKWEAHPVMLSLPKVFWLFLEYTQKEEIQKKAVEKGLGNISIELLVQEAILKMAGFCQPSFDAAHKVATMLTIG